MRLPGHRACQFSILIACLITAIQLCFDCVDLFLLVRNAFAPVVDEYRLSARALGLWNLSIQIEAPLLELLGCPFTIRRVGWRVIRRSSARP